MGAAYARTVLDLSKPLTMAVNLSAKQFAHPNLVDYIQAVLEENYEIHGDGPPLVLVHEFAHVVSLKSAASMAEAP